MSMKFSKLTILLVLTAVIGIGIISCTGKTTQKNLHTGVEYYRNILFSETPFDLERGGHPITADEACHNGILNHVVTAEKLEEETLLHAHAILKNAPKAVCVLKKQFSLLTKGNSINAETAEHIQALRREVYTSNDYVEAIAAFKEKRKPCFKGN